MEIYGGAERNGRDEQDTTPIVGKLHIFFIMKEKRKLVPLATEKAIDDLVKRNFIETVQYSS